MRIVRLRSRNVKRLKIVDIRPDETMNVVGGRNDQGKSSLLHSIVYALSGKRKIPSRPLRDGAKDGETLVDLGDIVVKRFYTKKRTWVEIVKKPGTKPEPRPQEILDELLGRGGDEWFDPERFARMQMPDQLATLKRLVGLDFSDLDSRRDKIFRTRTETNRSIKDKKAVLKALPEPEEEVDAEARSVADLMQELMARQEVNKKNAVIRKAFQKGVETINRLKALKQDLEAQLQRITEQLQEAEARQVQTMAEVRALVDADEEEIQDRICKAEARAEAARAAADYRRLSEEIDALEVQSGQMTDEIAGIDEEKAKRISAVEMPIEGLGITDDAVTLDGIPLDQVASSKRLRVGVGIALKQLGEIRVLLIQDGPMLDKDNKEVIYQMAKKAHAQVFIEEVDPDSPNAIIIEDGRVSDE